MPGFLVYLAGTTTRDAGAKCWDILVASILFVAGGVVTVRVQRLDALVQGNDYGVHTLELDVPGPGLSAYTFTFG